MAFIQLSKEEAKERVKALVDIFKANYEQYKLQTYKEERVMKEFIDKFFIALGWDVNNEAGDSEQFKDVINQDAIKIGTSTKAPDYAFRLGGTRIFFVEAKSPNVSIRTDSESSYQLRHYAWNSQDMPMSILTDFEEFVVYDCRIKPKVTDKADVARIAIINFKEYLDKFDEIWDVFSKQSVRNGSFEKYAKSNKDKKGTSEVGDEFLKEIEGWRDNLAKNIAIRNPQLSITELNYCVQKVIDKIIFLIICEYKHIESYGKLKELGESSNIYKNLLPYFKDADDKYNSGIFDLKNDALTLNLNIDDKILKEIIINLYYPNSPYDFSIIPIEILGSVYERFLGKTIRLTASHQAKVEEKPEVRKAGGVYYTPQYVVDYIVRNTVDKVIAGKTPKQIEKIKILDSACGSGTFLVRAYSHLLDYHLNYYKENKPEKYKKEVYLYKQGQWLLTTDLKKQILLNNIFGVDIDSQAVELTKLSLLLKVLENETKENVEQQLKLFRERALPNLDKNIRCGNSVVDSTYFKQTKLTKLSQEEIQKINPFDWENTEKGFGNVLKEGKFDIIVGNPPYVKEYTNREIFEPVKLSYLSKYYQGKMDFWYLFTCHATDLLKEGGLHSYIAPNNWITNAGASILRNKIISETKILSFFDFSDYKVFKDASIQTMVFVLEKSKPPKTYSMNYTKILDGKISKDELRSYLATGKDGNKIEHFKVKITPAELKDRTITFTTLEFNDILDKIKEKGKYHLTEDNVAQGIVSPQESVIDSHFKTITDGSITKGEGIFVLTSDEVGKLKLTLKEKAIIKPYFTSGQLFRYEGYLKNNLWIIYSNMEVRKNIKDYPHIKEHLDKFKKVITSDFAPYGLHRAREERFFEGEKIISLRKTSEPFFTYTNFPCYVSQTYFVIKPSDINLKYLTGLLNSKLIFFWLKYKGKMQGGQLQIDKAPLLEIPIYKIDSNNKNEMKLQEDIIKNVDMIRELVKKSLDIKLESQKDLIQKQIETYKSNIDDLVYKLYGVDITEDEKKIIEESLN